MTYKWKRTEDFNALWETIRKEALIKEIENKAAEAGYYCDYIARTKKQKIDACFHPIDWNSYTPDIACNRNIWKVSIASKGNLEEAKFEKYIEAHQKALKFMKYLNNINIEKLPLIITED